MDAASEVSNDIFTHLEGNEIDVMTPIKDFGQGQHTPVQLCLQLSCCRINPSRNRPRCVRIMIPIVRMNEHDHGCAT